MSHDRIVSGPVNRDNGTILPVRHACLAVATAVWTCGCNSLLGIEDLTLVDGGPADAPIDQPPAACFGSFVKACFPAAPTAPLMLMGPIDTSTDPRCIVVPQPMGPEICAMAGTQVIVAAMTTVSGARPLMLVASGNIQVSARLDVGSTIAGTGSTGPGANSALCDAPVNGVTSAVLTGGSGGAGGSFATAGGGGGAGNGTGAGAATAANPPQPSPTVLRGGCAGGNGGSSGAGGTGGDGGDGGGAVYLFAGGTIAIGDTLRASGAAGKHGTVSNGAGGAGGSGGMIVLEATTISVNGAVIANGGGGGEGSRGATGADGTDDRAFDQAPIGGSGGSSDGGNGGAGAFLTTAAVGGNSGGGGGGGGAGGGGGGGGLGLIRVKGTLAGTAFSPMPVPL